MELKGEGIPQLIVRLALGIGFLIPVADRIGLMGPPGAPNVNWGDWKHFTDYAHMLMPILPESASGIFALLATLGEVVFGINLIIGYHTQRNAIGAAGLTLLFALSMIFSQGILAPIKYPVFVFVGASALLACVQNPQWSIDRMLNNKK